MARVAYFRVAYFHGMGGGADSRIPSILKEYLPEWIILQVITYDFDPEVAHDKIDSWMREFRPDIVVGESLGALHALRVPDVPRILVSPALGAAGWLGLFSFLTYLPGVTALLDRKYRPREGDRQALHFTPGTLKKYRLHSRCALNPHGGSVFAFFGKHDHYLKWKVVSIKRFRNLFGPESYELYDGTHFMEEEYVKTLLLPRIIDECGSL